MSYRDNFRWRPYVPVAERRRKAERALQKLSKKGQPARPVVIEGRAIARTFWGQAWCDNLEGYSDFENRLPRGRTYVRNGSVLDLQIAPGEVSALVSGSQIYRVAVKVSAVPKARWKSICTDCAGAIDSLVELLQGRFAKGVMERICRQQTGLFPAPAEIGFSCSCPDWAYMCKHVAAVLYGIGARLDEQPELLFTLRQVDAQDLIPKAGKELTLYKSKPADDKVLVAEGLSELFGLELGTEEDSPMPEPGSLSPKPVGKRRPAKRGPAKKKAPAPTKAARRRITPIADKKAPKPKAKVKPLKVAKKPKKGMR
jgi:uncharacterized Zn finger protein